MYCGGEDEREREAHNIVFSVAKMIDPRRALTNIDLSTPSGSCCHHVAIKLPPFTESESSCVILVLCAHFIAQNMEVIWLITSAVFIKSGKHHFIISRVRDFLCYICILLYIHGAKYENKTENTYFAISSTWDLYHQWYGKSDTLKV